MPPLAYSLRPKKLVDFVGQPHLLGPQSWLRQSLAQGNVPPLLFYGPPGCGKTSLAFVIAQEIKAEFFSFNAGVARLEELKKILAPAGQLPLKRILFLDEIHRFNRAQQDYLLPFLEKGKIIFLGATTENPSFALNAALLSRLSVLPFRALSSADLEKILLRAEKKINFFLENNQRQQLARLARGDARFALNMLERAQKIAAGAEKITAKKWQQLFLAAKPLLYDRQGEEHYNLISAFHKSLRDSDADAALYWALRMLAGGEDPLYIARRMVRFASEDIGNADPRALSVALAVKQSIEFLGMPEADTALAQGIAYLARAPKSNACYRAVQKAKKDIKEFGALPVPLHLRNPVTKLMQEWGYGKGYKYAHDYPNSKVEQEHFPPELKNKKYF